MIRLIFISIVKACILYTACCLVALSVQAAVVFDMLEIGNARNVANPSTGRGSVRVPYRMADTPVTNNHYVEFLNSVDPAGGNEVGLYNPQMGTDARGGITLNSGAGDGMKYQVRSDMGNKPVNFVSAYDSMRFVNWMNNGQGRGSTETGAYTITSDGIANNTIERQPIAGYVLPTSDEFYKSVFFDPRLEADGGPIGNDFYWMYPNQSDSLPTEALADAVGDIINSPSVNYNNSADWNGQNGNLTTVGSGGGVSYYGLLETGGNVWEWNDNIELSLFRGASGGSYASSDPDRISSLQDFISLPSLEVATFGFRVAYRYRVESVPEPGTLGYVVVIGILMQIRYRVCKERSSRLGA